MKFRKYEFTPSQWSSNSKKIQQTISIDNETSTSWVDCHVVELGKLFTVPPTFDEEGNVLTPGTMSDKHSVDILWNNEPHPDFLQFEVWPEPCGIHVFAGWEQAYADDYNNRQS